MTRTTLLVLSLVGVVLLVPLVGPVPAQSPDPDSPSRANPTAVDNCRVIGEPGLYVLTQNITQGGDGDGFTFASQTCLLIESDDVVFEGRGHRVDGTGVTDTTGITVGGENASVENVTVSDVTVTDWNRGIYVRNGDGVTIRGATAAGNAYGASVEHSSGTSIVQSRFADNLIGVYEGVGVSGTSFSAVTYGGNYAGDAVSDTGAADPEGPSGDRTTSTTTRTVTNTTTSANESG